MFLYEVCVVSHGVVFVTVLVLSWGEWVLHYE